MGSVVYVTKSPVETSKRRVPERPSDWDSSAAAQERAAKQKRVQAYRSVDEIDTMVTYFLEHKRFRDALILVMQCNTGLRISDILLRKWKDIFYPDGSARTSNVTETQKTGKDQTYYINQAVVAAANLYKSNMQRKYNPEDYIFISEAYHVSHTSPIDRTRNVCDRLVYLQTQPLHVATVSRMMTKAAQDIGLCKDGRRISTHSCRKMYADALDNVVDGYSVGKDLQEKMSRVYIAQQALGHSSASTTKRHYLTDEIEKEAAMRMNFGLAAINAYKERMAKEK